MKTLEDLQDLTQAIKNVQETMGFTIPVAITIGSGQLANHYFEKGDLETARKIIDYGTMILGGWILQNTESEIGEAAGMIMIGVPIQNELIAWATGQEGFVKLLIQAFGNITGLKPFTTWLSGLF